jgi:hypothetical protein
LTDTTKSMGLTSTGNHAESVNLHPNQIFYPHRPCLLQD